MTAPPLVPDAGAREPVARMLAAAAREEAKSVVKVDLLRSDAILGCLAPRPVRWVVRRIRGVEGSRERPVKEYLSWTTGKWVRLVGDTLPAECYLEEADDPRS